jgi:hypothetical protein
MAELGARKAPSQPDALDRIAIVDPRLKQLLAYWRRERGERSLPSRTNIDPAALKFVLGHLILWDVLPEPQQFRVRLQGSELEWWMGRDLTNRLLDELPSVEIAEITRRSLLQAIATSAPCHQIGSAMIADVPRAFEALYLPLGRDGETVNMVLAAVLWRDVRLAA